MRFTWIIIILLIAAACTDKKKIPSGVLPTGKMEKVLWDMIVAERFSTQIIMKDSTKKDVTHETFKLYSQVFSLNNITREEFVRSYKFYMTRPDLSKVMFDTILLRANRLKEENYRPKPEQPLDSLRKDSLSGVGKADTVL
jgi:uncharacterized protein DUF4296